MSKPSIKETTYVVRTWFSRVEFYIPSVRYYAFMDRRQILVLIAALTFLFVGGTVVSAQSLSGDAPRGNWDTSTSTGEIILDGESYYSVFQGEQDISRWRNVDGDDVTGEFLVRRPDGDTLDLERSIDRNQRTGWYESGDGELTARVREPRISSLDLFNRNGVRISSGADVRRQNNMILVRAEWNFVEAEDVRIEVTDSEGTDVTRAALSRDISDAQADLLPSGFSESFLSRETQGRGSTGYSSAYWLLDPDELSGGRNEIRVEGVEDLNFGRASDSMTISVGSQSTPSLSFDDTTVSQGERFRYTVTGAETGNYHAVAVRMRNVRDESNPNDVFRFIGDTREIGSTSDYAYAVVRISDRGRGVGGIDSTHLERGSVTVRLFRAGSSVGDARDRIGGREADRRNIEVERSELSHSIGGTYVTGQSIDVSGTASPGVRRVAMYVRDRGDWEILPLNGRDTTPVRSDGTWRERNVVLSEEEYGGRNFRFPGTYSIAVVDAADLSSPPPRTISPSEFGRLSSSRTTTRVNEPRFVANIRSYIGEVAQGDRVHLSGISTGSRDVVVGFVGRGDVRAEVVRARRGNFIDTNIDIGNMRQGDVTAFVISPGRDGEFGDGSATDSDGNTVSITTPQRFRDYVRSFDRDGRTRTQKMSRIRDATVERAGSDDLMRTTNFRLTDPRTTVRDIVPGEQPQLSGVVPIEQGESLLVRGTTNRNPDDADITVEVTEGPDAAEFDLVTIRSWSGGTWSATFSTPGVSTGTYTVEVDDGESTDRRSFTVVDNREADPDDTQTLRQRLEEIRTELEAVRADNEEMSERVAKLREERDRLRERLNETETEQPGDGAEDETDDEEADDEGDGEGTPGFTALAALVALAAAAALVAKRRR